MLLPSGTGLNCLSEVLQMFERRMKRSVSLCLVFDVFIVFCPHLHGFVENGFAEHLKV